MYVALDINAFPAIQVHDLLDINFCYVAWFCVSGETKFINFGSIQACTTTPMIIFVVKSLHQQLDSEISYDLC